MLTAFHQAWCAPLNGLIFASYRYFMRVQVANPDDEPTLTQICLAGTGSGIVSSWVCYYKYCKLVLKSHRFLTCPIELIKIRQQIALDLTSSRLTAREVTREIVRARGITGLYRGITSTMLRDVGYGPYFASVSSCFRPWVKWNQLTNFAPHASISTKVLYDFSKDVQSQMKGVLFLGPRYSLLVHSLVSMVGLQRSRSTSSRLASKVWTDLYRMRLSPIYLLPHHRHLLPQRQL